MSLDKKIIDLIANFFVNLSSSYFIAATVVIPLGVTNNKLFFNFFPNIFFAIIYFRLSVIVIQKYG